VDQAKLPLLYSYSYSTPQSVAERFYNEARLLSTEVHLHSYNRAWALHEQNE
jgi:hypothetical protein